MKDNYVIVEKAFKITGLGTGICPVESLPAYFFGKKYNVALEVPGEKKAYAVASVESMLMSATKGIELFTFLLQGLTPDSVPKGTKIRIVCEVIT